jgi:hypothetical protein
LRSVTLRHRADGLLSGPGVDGLQHVAYMSFALSEFKSQPRGLAGRHRKTLPADFATDPCAS